jgi:hypothetical protein|tara:strand:+ start:577 stop:1056 length:480 start_codon:yes stop_codon:yes gene_type:complete
MAVREQNPFDTPVPGQSLTDTPGNYPWEHSPQFATVEDASHAIWNGIHKEDTMEKILVLLDAGLTVEEIVKVIVFAGFVEGKFNPDVGLLLVPIVSDMLVAMGKKAGIEKIKLERPKENTTEQLIETVLEQKPDNMKDEPEEEKKMSKGLMSKKEEEDK